MVDLLDEGIAEPELEVCGVLLLVNGVSGVNLLQPLLDDVGLDVVVGLGQLQHVPGPYLLSGGLGGAASAGGGTSDGGTLGPGGG